MTDAANPSGLSDEEAQESPVLHTGLPVMGCGSFLRPQLGVDLASLVLKKPFNGDKYDPPERSHDYGSTS